MPPFATHRVQTLTVLTAVFFGLLVWQGLARAGGPLLVGGTFGTPGQPFVWSTATAVSYTTDQGELGDPAINPNPNQLVRDAFDAWQNVSTANISFQQTTTPPDLGQDITDANVMSFLNSFEDCDQPAPSGITNAIIYDDDGAITDLLLGEGQNDTVLGFASAVCINSQNRITRGEAVLNGLFIDGQPDPEIGLNKYREVFVHEFGHLIGLDHSQVNVDVLAPTFNRSDDNLFGLPIMFPRLLSSEPARVDQVPPFPPLAPDDEAWVSFLYPSATFPTEFGFIEGKILFSDAETHVQGGNVIARQVDNLGTPEDESRRNAVSVVSGYKFTGNPGQSVTVTNDDGSSFGSRDTTLIGFYEIPLRPANYTVEVESINPEFVEGSSMGPLGSDAGEQFPLPGPPEFFNSTETESDDPALSDPVNVPGPPGERISDINIILNNTPTRFDTYESSARLHLREPAPTWVRREIPLDLLVTG